MTHVNMVALYPLHSLRLRRAVLGSIKTQRNPEPEPEPRTVRGRTRPAGGVSQKVHSTPFLGKSPVIGPKSPGPEEEVQKSIFLSKMLLMMPKNVSPIVSWETFCLFLVFFSSIVILLRLKCIKYIQLNKRHHVYG